MIAAAMEARLAEADALQSLFRPSAGRARSAASEDVADLALGNPVWDPPAEVLRELAAIASEALPGCHRYTPGAGLAATRQAVAKDLTKQSGLAYTHEDIVMTAGAAAGLNVVLRSLIDPGDEVLAFAPFFPDYPAYVSNCAGRFVAVPTDARFQPDLAALRNTISSRTRALLLNSPNNPSGVIYPEATVHQIGVLLRAESRRLGRPIYLVCDEAYREITFDETPVSWPARSYSDTIHVASFSKSLGIPGERIGYLAVQRSATASARLLSAFILATRILGFVNAPALQQRWVASIVGLRSPRERCREQCARLMAILQLAGYEFVAPRGGLYVFPRVPGGVDDVAFARLCMDEQLLVVPGSLFGAPGHFRLCFAVDDRALRIAGQALRRLRSRL